MRVVMLLGLLSAGCYAVGLSPKEVCARDEMVFAGRNYSSTVGDAGNVSGKGIECRRPQTEAERCEVAAATAALATKVEMCPDGSRCRLGKGEDCGARENANSEDACRIERKADQVYATRLAMCSAPDQPKTVGQLP